MRFSLAIVVSITAASDLQAQPRAWREEVLLQTERGMGGVAIGDLVPESPGNEIVAVNAAGEVWMVRRSQGQWLSERIHKFGGELIMCGIGDVDPRFPGNEFVGVGMVRGEESLDGPGQVVILHRDGKEWAAAQAFEDSHMMHGVAIGDVSTRTPGTEVVACGFNHRVTLLMFADGQWRCEVVYVANDRMKIAAVTDALPDRDGLEVVVSGSDGNVVVLSEGKLGWNHEIVYAGSVGQSRVAWGGNGILIGGDDGVVTFAQRRSDRWTTEVLARDSGKIRGVAVVDLDAAVQGPEFYACGYSRNVLQFWQDADRFWHTKVVFTEERPLHHLIAGEIDEDHPGLELVACGHSGRLIAISPPPK